jgi:hypothetical protein
MPLLAILERDSTTSITRTRLRNVMRRLLDQVVDVISVNTPQPPKSCDAPTPAG